MANSVVGGPDSVELVEPDGIYPAKTEDTPMMYREIITIEPDKRGGEPCIRGMRITVYDILGYLAAGMTHEKLLNEFPYLTEQDILAYLSYAAEREKSFLTLTS